MSEQPATPPPALRLKPRLRPAEGEASAGAPAVGDPTSFPPPPPVISTGAPLSTEVAEVPTAPKIRFKPKMAETSGATAAPGTATPALQVSEPVPAVIQPPTMANPHVTAPAPAPFVTPPTPPPLFVSDPSPAAPAAPAIATPPAAPAPAADSGAAPADANKFKLKPKAPSPIPPPAASAGAPPVVAAPPPLVAPPFAAPPSVKGAPPPVPGAKAPPPFPVVAPPVALKGTPPPSAPVAPAADLSDDSESSSAAAAPRKNSKAVVIGLAAVIVLGAGYFGWKYFMPQKATPAPTPTVKSTPPPAPVPKSDPAPTPSETLNKLAHAPKNAIDQAQEAIATRRASGQARIDAASIGEDLPDQPRPPAAGSSQPPKAAPKATTTTTTIAPNVSATTKMEAAPEATAPFRSFVANAKVSGVFQGSPARAVINGKLTRAGDVADPGLGITFEGIDSERRQLVFKDKTGATVSRRF
jgi:cytoskeletal protein RodZ